MKKNVKILLIVLVGLSLVLVMPCAAANVSVTVFPSTVTQGEKIFINGTAEGQPSSVGIWIIGKNSATLDYEPVNTGGSFSYEVKQDTTKSMFSGQYFVVVQHPGMNGLYDINSPGLSAGATGDVYVYDDSGTTPVSLFKIQGSGSLRGSDAFEALTWAIKSNQPRIDDTYTRAQFEIVSSSKIGLYKEGMWYLDKDGSGTWNAGDRANMFGAPGWTSVLGDWNGDGTTKIGIYKDGIWYLDYNGNGAWEGADKVFSFGAPGWTPIAGDWRGTGYSYIGVTNGQQWYLDWNGNGAFDEGDKAYSFGAQGWTPVVGKWT